MDPVVLPLVVGYAVSLVFQLLKRWQWLDCKDATVKQVTVCVLAAVGVFLSAGWKFDQQTLLQAVGAGVTALTAHKGLLKQPANPVKDTAEAVACAAISKL